MSRVPRKAPEPEHRAPTVRIPVGATLFLVAVATIYPGLFFLLGTLAYVCVHLVALGATSGLLPLGFAVVVLSAVTRSIPRRLKRFGFPRPRVTSALLLGATIAGVAQLVVLTFHAPFPFATFPLPLWLFPYTLVVPVAAVLLWTRGFRTSRNRWGAVILVLLLPVTSVGWGWIAENAGERHVQGPSGFSSDVGPSIRVMPLEQVRSMVGSDRPNSPNAFTR